MITQQDNILSHHLSYVFTKHIYRHIARFLPKKTLETIHSYYITFSRNKRLEINKRQLLNPRFLLLGKEKYIKIPFPTLPGNSNPSSQRFIRFEKKLQVTFLLSQDI